MINYKSAIAICGLENVPASFVGKTKEKGVELISFPRFLNQIDLGSKIREIVNQTTALFIFKNDLEPATFVQFYLAANKKVFYITDEETRSASPKSNKIFSTAEEALNELLQENERVVVESTIGNIELRFNDFGLTYLQISKKKPSTEKISKQTQKVQNQLESYFEGKRKAFHLKIYLEGTAFQRHVWTELLNIHYGNTLSYGELASKVGDSKASRAVGLANSKNPIWIVIPCHRVLSKEGDLTGYAGGLKLKQSLLDLESNQMSLF